MNPKSVFLWPQFMQRPKLLTLFVVALGLVSARAGQSGSSTHFDSVSRVARTNTVHDSRSSSRDNLPPSIAHLPLTKPKNSEPPKSDDSAPRQKASEPGFIQVLPYDEPADTVHDSRVSRGVSRVKRQPGKA